MKLSGPFRGIFGHTSGEAIVWGLRDGHASVVARNAGGARYFHGVPAWVQCKDGVPWGGGDPSKDWPEGDYCLSTAAGPFDLRGATDWSASAHGYTAYLGRLRWNAAAPVPPGSACWDTDPETDCHVLVLDRQTGRGLAIYKADGSLIGTLDIPVSWARLRDGVLCVLTNGRLLLADVTSAGISRVRTASTLFAPYQPHAVRYRETTWLVYHVADEGRGLLNRLVAHPEDSFSGYALTAPGIGTYGLDARAFDGDLFVGFALNEGETFGSGVIAAVPLSAPVNLRELLTPVEAPVVPAFPSFGRFVRVIEIDKPDARFLVMVGGDHPKARGIFFTIGQDDLAVAIREALKLPTPIIYAYEDRQHFDPARVPVVDDPRVTVIPTQQCYPKTGEHVDVTWQGISRSLDGLLARFPRVAVIEATYRQFNGAGFNWDLQTVLTLMARTHARVVADRRIDTVMLYPWVKTPNNRPEIVDGAVKFPELTEAHRRVVAAMVGHETWPESQESNIVRPTPQQIIDAVATAKQQTEAEGFTFPLITSWDEPAKVRAMRVMVRATWALHQAFPQAEIGLEHYGGDSGAEFLGDKYSPDIIAVGKGGAGSVTYDVLVAGATPAAQLGAAVQPADWRPVINPSKLPPVGIDPPPDDGGDDDDDPPPVDAAPILQLLTEIRNEQRQLGEQVTAVVALQQQLGGALMDAKQDLDKALQKLDRSYAGSFRVLGTTVPITLTPKE